MLVRVAPGRADERRICSNAVANYKNFGQGDTVERVRENKQMHAHYYMNRLYRQYRRHEERGATVGLTTSVVRVVFLLGCGDVEHCAHSHNNDSNST